jgi:hypothetical protein
MERIGGGLVTSKQGIRATLAQWSEYIESMRNTRKK